MSTATVRLSRPATLSADDFMQRADDGGLLQVCRAAVQTPDVRARVALFWPADPNAASLTLAELAVASAGEPAGTVAALVRAAAEGRVALELPRGSEAYAPAVAAVAAVMRVSWAWDESPAIRVTVNGAHATLAPRFTDGVWEAVEIPADAV